MIETPDWPALVLLLGGLALLSTALKTRRGVEPVSRRAELLSVGLALSAAMLCFASGWHVAAYRAERDEPVTISGLLPRAVAARQSFQQLIAAAPARRLMRLVAYDPATQHDLTIWRLHALGAPAQRFVFVADYDELNGCTAAEALYRLGGTLRAGQHVSCVIFPRGPREVYPANVRGLLQVVEQIDAANTATAGYRAADLAGLLSTAARAALADRQPGSWAWRSYSPYFEQYAAAVDRLRAAECSALAQMGHVGRDWSGFGYAQLIGRAEKEPQSFQLALNGRSLALDNYGARVFLVENQPLEKLAGSCLIDFDHPERQRIADLEIGDERAHDEMPHELP